MIEMYQLTDSERRVLALIHANPGKINYKHEINQDGRNAEAFISLCRFRLAKQGEWKNPGGAANTPWPWEMTPAGTEMFDQLHDQTGSYSCCEHSIRMDCVCRCSVYCPTHGGTCHGTHD